MAQLSGTMFHLTPNIIISQRIKPCIRSNIVAANDNTTAKQIYSQLKANPNKLVLFQGKYQNLNQSYIAIKRFCHEESVNSMQKLKFGEQIDVKKIFLESRALKNFQAELLNKLVFTIDDQATPLSITDAPVVNTAKEVVSKSWKYYVNSLNNSNAEKPPGLDLTAKPQLLLSFHHFYGIKSADQWSQKGLQLEALEDAKIFPFYNTFTPTRQDYTNMFRRGILQQRVLESLPSNPSILDIGIGTGVLSFILCKLASRINKLNELKIVGTEFYEEGLACAKYNAEQLGYAQHIKLVECDMFPRLEQVADFIPVRKSTKNAAETTPSPKFDLIVCNPPFLPGKPVTLLDAGIYDEDSKFVKKLLKEAPQHLTPKGHLVMLFSNLPFRLGLLSRTFIEELCAENGLQVVNKIQMPSSMLHRTKPVIAYSTNKGKQNTQVATKKDLDVEGILEAQRNREDIQFFVISRTRQQSVN